MDIKIIRFSLALLLLCLYSSVSAQAAALLQDIEKLNNARHGIEDVLVYIETHPQLFSARQEQKLRTREQREAVWQTWRMFMDRLLIIDQLGSRYQTWFYQAAGNEKPQFFRLGYAAFLAEYRLAMDFINLMERDPRLHTILNEPVDDLGIEAGQYSRLKFRFLNVLRGAEFVRLNTLYQFYGADASLSITRNVEKDIAAIWQAGMGTGPQQTSRNALKVVQEIGFTVWFPLQKEVSEWMGDTKVWRVNQSLISPQQINEMQRLLQPGDILLERREWYLSNVGLPGYWPHAAIYVGTEAERERYFDSVEVRDFFRDSGGRLNSYLKRHSPQAYQHSIKKYTDGHLPRVIEAISEGVSFTSLQHSVDADSVVILRPRLSRLEKARAIVRAFAYAGRPYDFNFDFLTDASLVCTELVYKAYEPDSEQTGIRFPLSSILGRRVTTANDIARMFASEHGKTDQQLTFVAFYDGWEQKGRAIASTVTAFKQSWRRPKWHILIQDKPVARQTSVTDREN